MQRGSDSILQGDIRRPRFDWLLRFDRATEERYAAEHDAERVEQLRNMTVFGFLLYIMHGISKAALFPGSGLLIAAVTAFVVMPFVVSFFVCMGRLTHRSRENLLLFGISISTALPLYTMYNTELGIGLFSNVDVLICVVFGNVLVAMRFKHSFSYTFVTMSIAILAISINGEIEAGLKKALVLQFATVCIICLYSNYLFERRRCQDYCASLDAVLRAEAAETSEKQFQVMSRTDALTGLPNRRFLDEKLEEWAGESRSAAVMMIDIDHFKLFNDALGHPAGDECLRMIGDMFAQVFSEPDQFCARFGGEEFTLAIRDANELQARRMAQAVVAGIEVLRIPHPGRTDGMNIVTVSVGVALKPENMTTSRQELLCVADDALYQAKRKGRNCFVVSDGMPASQTAVNS